MTQVVSNPGPGPIPTSGLLSAILINRAPGHQGRTAPRSTPTTLVPDPAGREARIARNAGQNRRYR